MRREMWHGLGANLIPPAREITYLYLYVILFCLIASGPFMTISRQRYVQLQIVKLDTEEHGPVGIEVIASEQKDK